jgi:tetratricopeptide (TPR) repeat protein
MRRLNGSLAALIVLCWASCAEADTILLNNGQTVQGKILKDEKDSILVDAGIDTPVTYFKDEIKLITPNAETNEVSDPEARRQGDELESKALELIDGDKMEQGLELIRKAIEVDPTPQRRMNYGSILFGNGVATFKLGDKEEGKKILHQSEEQLTKALEGFDKSKDADFMSQINFLLGEMNNNAFEDPAKARAYYTQALSFSEHQGAKAALAKLK